MVCQPPHFPPLPVYPIVLQHAGLPVGGNKTRISCHSPSCALVPVGVVNLATCVCVKSEEEEPGEKNLSNILNVDCNT